MPMSEHVVPDRRQILRRLYHADAARSSPASAPGASPLQSLPRKSYFAPELQTALPASASARTIEPGATTVTETSHHQELAELIQGISVPRDIQRDFYLFVAIFTDWLEQSGIPYFLHSGTALGSARHAGFIPWDDDFDIMVEEEHEARLIEGFADLERYGVRLSDKHRDAGHYQFYFQHPRVPSTAKRYYCFDIFIGRRETVDGRLALHYKHPDFRRWFADRQCFVDDVYPLQRQPFGPLSLWAMRDPSDYFRRSNFRIDEATLRIHMIDQAWLEERISYFTKLGLYPIRDSEILRRRTVMQIEYGGLDTYRLR